MFEMPNMHLHVVIVCLIMSCQSIGNVLPCRRFIFLSDSKKFSLMKQSTSSRVALVVSKNCMKSKKCRYITWGNATGHCNCQGFSVVWCGTGWRLWTFFARGRSCLWEFDQCRTVRRNTRTRGKLQRDIRHVRNCVVVVTRHVGTNLAPPVSISLFAVLMETLWLGSKLVFVWCNRHIDRHKSVGYCADMNVRETDRRVVSSWKWK